MKNKYTFIDLFAGCGGLSEGFLQTNRFEALAHVEWEKPMVDTLRNRLVQTWKHTRQEANKRVIQFDVQRTEELIYGNWSEKSIKEYGNYNDPSIIKNGLKGLVGKKQLDLIIGGPPCQAYSIAGRAQDPHSMKDDYRNYLFESFVKIVEAFHPKAFVFENVPGILSACPGDRPVINRIYTAFKEIGYEIRTPQKLKDSIFCAEDYETPQKRNRIIIFGVESCGDIKLESLYDDLRNRKSDKHLTVKDAIGDLPRFLPLKSPKREGRRNVSHYCIEKNDDIFHDARYHNPRDITVFRDWLTKNMNYYSQEEKLAYYTKITGKKSNHIKYRSLEWDKPSPTVVAHLYKDGLMFIHPDIDQLRSITIREAACLQSFPKDFQFIASQQYCFKMIGNAVPVAFARNIGYSISSILDKLQIKI